MSVNKLKHIALKEIHYQLFNIVLIIHTEGNEYCDCWAYYGCRQKPQFDNLIGARNYCHICQLLVNYKPSRIENLRSIQQTWQLYLKMKEDLEKWKSTNFMRYRIFWNKNYWDKYKEYRSHLVKKVAVREYIEHCYNYLVWSDP